MKMQKKMSCKIISVVLALTFVISMVPIFSIGVSAYQSAFKSGGFTDTARAKMASFSDGDNIFEMGAARGDMSSADFNKSGDCQFCYQNNDGKWGRAIKDTAWAINGMANVGDGVIDTALTTGSAATGGLWFSRTPASLSRVDADGNVTPTGKYFVLSGWEFAADFTVKGFKIYFNKTAAPDDFDILVGHIAGDGIAWEVAFCGEDMTAKYTDETSYTNATVSYSADFCKTMEGRFIQIAIKGTEGLNTTAKEGHAGFFCPEFEVYKGTVDGVNHDIVEAPATATCTEAGLAAHYKCAGCGALYSDAEGLNAISEEDIAIPALGHRFVDGECVRCSDTAEAIEDADDFAAMAADGAYYLANDITIDTSYAETFTGIFDGQGYTIINSAPVFTTIGGSAEIRNIVLGGKGNGAQITSEATDAPTASLASNVANPSNVTVDNIINYTNVTNQYRAGSIIGQVACSENGKVYTTVTNCVNYGNISGANMVGGVVGYAQRRTLTVDNCVNYGNVTSTGNLAGGVVGRFGMDKALASDVLATVTSCANYGTVSAKSYAGGIVGNIVGAGIVIEDSANFGAVTGGTTTGGILGTTTSSGDYKSNATLTRCLNAADITSTGKQAGGLCGYAYGSGSSNNIKCYSCVNTGSIEGATYVSQLVGYCNSASTTLENCVAAGSIGVYDGAAAFLCFIGSSSQKAINYKISNVYYISDEEPDYFGYSATAGNESAWDAKVGIISVDQDKLESGELAVILNTNLDKNVFGQNLDNGRPVGTAPIPNGAAVYAYTDCQGNTRYTNDANRGSHIDNDKDGVCDLCGTGDATRFTGAQLVVGEAFTLKFFAAVSSANQGGKVVFSSEGKEDVELAIGDASKEGNEYVFVYSDIAPNEMGNTITATILDAGDKVVTVKEYSVDECREALAETYPGNKKMIELLDKLEDYGKAAEEYLAAVANDAIPTLNINVRIKAEDVTALNLVDGGDYSGDAKFVSAGVYFNNKNRLYFKFTNDVTKLVIKVAGKSNQEFTSFATDGDYYKVYSDEISATELGDVYTVEIYDGSDLAQTLTYSVYTYCYSMQDSADIATANLVKATYLYGVAAAAYAD